MSVIISIVLILIVIAILISIYLAIGSPKLEGLTPMDNPVTTMTTKPLTSATTTPVTTVNPLTTISVNPYPRVTIPSYISEPTRYPTATGTPRPKVTSIPTSNPMLGTQYNSDNFDLTYHADPTTTTPTDENTAGPGKMWVKDKSGNLIALPYGDVSNSTLYYQAGSYPYGPSSYVPNYEESVYLSKLTNEPTTKTISDFPFQKAGFCEETSLIEKEKKCNSLDKNVCASTECCVLLGGEKCVAGNEYGPTNKANYSDFLVKNRDFYYYKGKCHGNCM